MTTQGKETEVISMEEASEEMALHQLRFWRTMAHTKVVLQKTAIWGVFFFVLYLLRDFFPLIFLTFVLSFVSSSMVRVLGRWAPGLGWKRRVVMVFTAFLLGVALVVYLAIPQIKNGLFQLNEQVSDLPQVWEEKIDPWLYEKSGFYERLVTRQAKPAGSSPRIDPNLGPMEMPAPEDDNISDRISLWKNEQIRDWVNDKRGALVASVPAVLSDAVTAITAVFSLLFLSILFSFLIVLDLENLRHEIRKLEGTKLAEFYRQTIGSIVRFGAVLGKVLEAQAVIAFVNTVLTAIGLWAMGIPNIWFLSFAVFVCGFIPVAGVFISSVPICLVGLYVDGVSKMLLLIAFITGIHFLEAYVLNPRIMGAALRVNPILVLVILVIGHHALGVWGLLLGLPICYYFFTHVIKREESEIGLRVKFRKRAPANPS